MNILKSLVKTTAVLSVGFAAGAGYTAYKLLGYETVRKAVGKKIVDKVMEGIDVELGKRVRVRHSGRHPWSSGEHPYHGRYRRYHHDIFFDTRQEAEEVLAAMKETITTYGNINIADLCDLIEMDMNDVPIDSLKYGWTDLTDAKISSVTGGYSLILPKPKLI